MEQPMSREQWRSESSQSFDLVSFGKLLVFPSPSTLGRERQHVSLPLDCPGEWPCRVPVSGVDQPSRRYCSTEQEAARGTVLGSTWQDLSTVSDRAKQVWHWPAEHTAEAACGCTWVESSRHAVTLLWPSTVPGPTSITALDPAMGFEVSVSSLDCEQAVHLYLPSLAGSAVLVHIYCSANTWWTTKGK